MTSMRELVAALEDAERRAMQAAHARGVVEAERDVWRGIVADRIERPAPAVRSALTARPTPHLIGLRAGEQRQAAAILRAAQAGLTPQEYTVRLEHDQ